MPMSFEVKSTPGGRPYVYSVATGVISQADAEGFNAHFRGGGDFAGKPLLTVMSDDAKYSVEARKALIGAETKFPAIAVVVRSAALRVMLNFMLKASEMAGQSQVNLRSFATEAEALAWLEGELAKAGS